MKNNKNKYAGLLLALAIIFQVSCKKSFFTDANINPNSPPDAAVAVSPYVLLSNVESSVAYVQGGDISRFSGLFDQQLYSASRQAGAYYIYTVTSSDMDNLWGNLYTSVMENDKTLMNFSDSANYHEYSGISRILMAYSLQMAVDCWGKVPYSQALTGVANLHPAYDDDKALYDTIASLINVGIQQLNNPDPGLVAPSSSDDNLYKGDPTGWIKFGHAIKARLYIHQSKGSVAMADSALSEIAQSFASNSESAIYPFLGNTETTANPVYQFNEQRGDIDYPSATLAGYMSSLSDPRYGIYFDSTYSDVNEVGVGDYYGGITAPVQFITYEELQFMQAEATLRATGDIPTAQGFYQAGITASFQKFGLDPTGYLASNGILPTTSAADAIAQVAVQENIALYQNPEAWTLYRRTGSPVLTPQGGTNGVPRRFLYPESEYTLNAANVPVPAGSNTLFAPKVFWDN
jgi:hypothetical protein